MHVSKLICIIPTILLLTLSNLSFAQTWLIPTANSAVTATSKIGITGGTLPLQIVADNTSQIQFYTGSPSLARLIIDKDGKIGTGITPAYYFHVQNSNAADIGLTTSAGNGLLFQVQTSATNLVPFSSLGSKVIQTIANTGNNDLVLAAGGAGYIKMGTNGVQRMMIDNQGRIEFGTSTTNSDVIINLSEGSAGGSWGWTRSFALNIRSTKTANSALSIGADGPNSYYIGRNSSGLNVINLNMDANVKVGMTLSVVGKSNLLENVAIGTAETTSTYRLDVKGITPQVAKFTNTTGTSMISVHNSSNVGWGMASAFGNTDGVPAGSFYIENISKGTRMVISPTGNVGIGTANPNSDTKLHVVGNMKVEGKLAAVEICANLQSSWCDYVFESDYELPQLKEVKKFIEKNKHLPGIPSERDVKANGYNLTSMDAALLKKLEEAYLYILNQEERIRKLEGKQ